MPSAWELTKVMSESGSYDHVEYGVHYQETGRAEEMAIPRQLFFWFTRR